MKFYVIQEVDIYNKVNLVLLHLNEYVQGNTHMHHQTMRQGKIQITCIFRHMDLRKEGNWNQFYHNYKNDACKSRPKKCQFKVKVIHIKYI